MSLTLAQIIKEVDQQHPNVWSGPEIGTTLAFLCGFIVLGIGLLRLGRIVDLIPAPAISGFMTGSALNIIASQVPGLMGITGFECVLVPLSPPLDIHMNFLSTRAATFLVIINTLKGLPITQKDAAFGLTGLFALYAIRIACSSLTKRYPRRGQFKTRLKVIHLTGF
jgi:sodium-independent sulfate anion transporter 11